MEGDIEALSKVIFENEMKDPKSVQIVGSFLLEKDLFEALLMLFTRGMRIMFGNGGGTVDLDDLTEKDIILFSDRFKSIGVVPVIYKYHVYQVKTFREEDISTEILNDWNSKDKDIYLKQDTLNKTILTPYIENTSKNLADFYFQFISKYNYYIVNYTFI